MSGEGLRIVKVLVLHGKAENGSKFRSRFPQLEQLHPRIEWEFLDAPHLISGSDDFAWWTLPPGVRSFDAEEYIGIQKTFEVIEDAWTRRGPFDAVLGVSQGAILISILLARAIEEDFIFKPKAAILVGAAWPKPFDSVLKSVMTKNPADWSYKPRNLHVYCMQDDINPPAMAIRLKQVFAPGGAEELVHGAGHTLPVDSDSLSKLVRFLDLDASTQKSAV